MTVVSQARPNQPQRGSLSVSRRIKYQAVRDTESDPRWGWLGLACETRMTAFIRKISVGAEGRHTLSPEESLRQSISFGKLPSQ